MTDVDEFKKAALAEKARIEALAPRIGVEVVRVSEAQKRLIEARGATDLRGQDKALATLRDAMGRLRALHAQLGPVAKKLAPETVATAEEALAQGEARLAFLAAEHAEEKALQARRGARRPRR